MPQLRPEGRGTTPPQDQKADKCALDGKVSREEFDATTDQLNTILKDMLGREIGQEQDWQKVLQKINYEMQKKLDRMALDPIKNNLEKQWKKIYQMLKECPPWYDYDEAAGIRKQILTIPKLPRLPSHRSNRPYTVYDLEQVQQHDCRFSRKISATSSGISCLCICKKDIRITFCGKD
ncbi:glutamine-rich protein 2-like isoform X2 [Mixophyes fleayi]|uniref:glutamine-rich protein 2-like isoform X2 n=1 Tax=Mixophyes fleayi TaxID=3061075 RepID=UPI003F4E3655